MTTPDMRRYVRMSDQRLSKEVARRLRQLDGAVAELVPALAAWDARRDHLAAQEARPIGYPQDGYAVCELLGEAVTAAEAHCMTAIGPLGERVTP
jgi:hypothetical protein